MRSGPKRQLKKLLLIMLPMLGYIIFAHMPWQRGGAHGNYALADGPAAGNVAMPGPMGPACQGDMALASGIGEAQAPCMAAFKNCVAVYNPGPAVTPAVGSLSCAPTATTTVISSATATVTAVMIIQASPAGSASVVWFGGPR